MYKTAGIAQPVLVELPFPWINKNYAGSFTINVYYFTQYFR